MDIYRGITKATQLLLDGMEAEYDFKQSANVDAEDIVAFANHPRGGVMLLGVEEVAGVGGLHRGRAIGCETSDRTRNAILQKAASCHPPIEVVVSFENMATEEHIIRVDIPSGKMKPYCTSGGTYKIRDNGKNLALVPTHLLGMFVEAEQTRFIAAFQSVGAQLQKEFVGALSEVQANTTDQLRSLDEGWLIRSPG
jgi:predicted HTH transcriptional regulator